MTRTIKFRGRAKYNGKFVYGDLAHVAGMTAVDCTAVDPESVAQLIGVDKNDNEIYEGDTYTAHNSKNTWRDSCRRTKFKIAYLNRRNFTMNIKSGAVIATVATAITFAIGLSNCEHDSFLAGIFTGFLRDFQCS